ncbi:MAG: Ig-like domain-containing protein [Clostridiales Family XIII bacterium]|nr:Ig-like domain-containing protein [Clostridiales Family XIII bacterium]
MKSFLASPAARTAAIIAAVIVVAAAAIALALRLGVGEPRVEYFSHFAVYATSEGAGGMEPDSSFVIKSDEPQDLEELRGRLSLTPAADYKLRAESSKKFVLEPKEPLALNTVYCLAISLDGEYSPPLSWAFQTKDAFAVKSVFPRDGAYSVPIDSGIEMTFSRELGEGAEESFVISPKTAGRLMVKEGGVLVFAPEGTLFPETQYHVTVMASPYYLRSKEGEYLDEDFSFSFRTAPSRSGADGDEAWIYPYNDKDGETFTVSDDVYIAYRADKRFGGVGVEASLYRLGSLREYMDALKQKMEKYDYRIPVDSLALAYSFETKFVSTGEDSYWEPCYYALPEKPGAGWYLLDARTVSDDPALDAKHLQRLIQVTDISVYSLSVGDKAAVWLNDAGTGFPLGGADVSLGHEEGKSDANGLCVLEDDWHSSKEKAELWNPKELRVSRNTSDGRRLEFGDWLYLSQEPELGDKYYTYVYTDRELYHPTDKVRFWGMALPRAGDTERVEEILLDWRDGGRYPEGIRVKVGEDGSFSGELDLDRHAAGYESLRFKLGDEPLVEKSINIFEFEKPVYTLSHSFDKAWYRKGDKINMEIQGMFFDGAPAEGLKLGLNAYGHESYGDEYVSGARELALDKSGKAAASYATNSHTSWRPVYLNFHYKTTGAETTAVSGSGQARYFPSDYMLEARAERGEDALARLRVSACAIDFSKVGADGSTEGRDYAGLKGAPAGFSCAVEITETEYLKEKSGSYYDFLNKRTVETYSYKSEDRLIEAREMTGEEGALELALPECPDEESKSYSVKISCRMPDGSLLEETVAVPSARFRAYSRYSRGEGYFFRDNGFDDDVYSGRDEYNYGTPSHGLGQKVSMSAVDWERRRPDHGRLLYVVAGANVFDGVVLEDGRFNFSFYFETRHTPNVRVMGAYFKDGHVFAVAGCGLRYDYPEKSMEVEVIPSKERYAPGETFRAELTLKDHGRPVRGSYLLSVADEAAFAVYNQEARPLEEIYRMLYQDYREYVSYTPPVVDAGGAEMGDGGADDSYRKDFADTAAFITGETGADGRAWVSFKLPDNITSWRLTAIAYSGYKGGWNGVQTPLAGKSLSNVTAGLPFFINAAMNTRYIAGDSVGVTLRSAGLAVGGGDQVSYEAEVVSAGGGSGAGAGASSGPLPKKSAAGAAGEFVAMDFGALPEGEYALRVRAKAGRHSDAAELPFTVTDSLLSFPRETRGELGKGLSVSTKRWPVELALYDLENSLYYDVLGRLDGAGRNRADQIMASALAGDRLAEMRGETPARALPPDDGEAAEWKNGIRMWPYSEHDPLLTAKAAVSVADYLDREALTSYFNRIVSDGEASRSDLAAAYMGLGALRAPVLFDLRGLVRDGGDFSLTERTFLAVGLAAMGDKETARNWYEDNLSPDSHDFMVRDGDSVYARYDGKAGAQGVFKNAREAYMLTAATAMLTTVLGDADAAGFTRRIQEYSFYDYEPLPELMAWLAYYAPRPSQSRYSYKLGGKEIVADFEKETSHYLEMGEEQLAGADFKVLEGRVGWRARYAGSLEEARGEALDGVTVRKSLSKDTLKLGETLEVTVDMEFSPKATAEGYVLNAAAPSGLRFVGFAEQGWNSAGYAVKGEGGNLRFYVRPVYPDGNVYNRGYDPSARVMPEKVSLTYYARAVLPGEYVVEADAYGAENSSIMRFTERGRVRVEP